MSAGQPCYRVPIWILRIKSLGRSWHRVDSRTSSQNLIASRGWERRQIAVRCDAVGIATHQPEHALLMRPEAVVACQALVRANDRSSAAVLNDRA
jgi:hypothetical protein